MLKLGSAPDSWGIWFAGDPKQLPWQRFLDELSEVGYRWTELGPYGYLPTDPDVLARELEVRNLGVAGGFVKFDLEAPDIWTTAAAAVDETSAFVWQVGGEYIVIIDKLGNRILGLFDVEYIFDLDTCEFLVGSCG